MSKLLRCRLFILIPLTLLAGLLSYGLTENIDHFGYYLPTIKWMEQFAVIRGSALFNHRIGFNSNFHLLGAIYGLHDILSDPAYYLNGILFVLFNYHFLDAGLRLVRERGAINLADLILASAAIFQFSFLVDSMDADYLTIMGGLTALSLIVKKSEAEHEDNSLVAILLIVMFLVSVRLLSVFLLMPLFFILLKSKNAKQTTLFVFIAVFYLAPWLMRNYFISGYLIFPLHYIDLFDVPWKTPSYIAQASYDIISEFAKVNIIREDYLYDGMRSWSIREWFPKWITLQKTTIIGIVSIVLLPLSLLSSLLNLIKIKSGGHRALIVCSWIFLVYWFFNIPSIRFAWAWILLVIVMNTYIFFYPFISKHASVYRYAVAILLVLSWTRLAYNTISDASTTSYNINETIGFSEEKLDEIIVRRSYDTRCGNTIPPCLPNNNPLTITPIGPRIQNGFKLLPSEIPQ